MVIWVFQTSRSVQERPTHQEESNLCSSLCKKEQTLDFLLLLMGYDKPKESQAMPLEAKTYEVLYTNHESIDEFISGFGNIEVYYTIVTPCLFSAFMETR